MEAARATSHKPVRRRAARPAAAAFQASFRRHPECRTPRHSAAVMQTDRHQRAVRRHPVEALPGLADVLAAVERAVFR
jgi:hypothetical protein